MKKVIFDIETTGLSREHDRIVELAIKVIENGKSKKKRYLFKPEIEISKEAQEIHGITPEIVKNAPTFKEMVPEIIEYFRNSIIITYNGTFFDVPFMLYEFERAGFFIAFENCRFVDVYKVYSAMNPRTLEAAYYSYCNGKFDAHRAGEDVRATEEVLKAMIKEHSEELDGGSLETLEELSSTSKLVDIAGYLTTLEGEICFSKGKHAKSPIKLHKEYCKWVLRNDFPEQTKNIIRKTLNW